jgi:thioredoxin
MAVTSIACPACTKTNRVPSERLGDGPRCGHCKKPLFSARPMTLTAANAAAMLNNTELPVLVDCWASWCGPCRSFAPVFEQAAARFEPRVRFAKLDTEANQSLAARWGIRSIPTLILFRGGKEVDRVSGALPAAQLAQWLSRQWVN